MNGKDLDLNKNEQERQTNPPAELEIMSGDCRGKALPERFEIMEDGSVISSVGARKNIESFAQTKGRSQNEVFRQRERDRKGGKHLSLCQRISKHNGR